MAKNNLLWPLPLKAKFAKGDFIMLRVKSNMSDTDTWIGVVETINTTNYGIKCLTNDAKSITNVPFLFEPLMSLVKPEDLENAIKNIKLLYLKR